MIRALAIIGIGCSIALFAWSSAVWERCGYDCGLFGVASGLTAVVINFGAIILFVGSVTALSVAHFLTRRSRKVNGQDS